MKRKADTTTPMGSSFEGGYTTPTIDQQGGPKPAKISTRRESGRQKKVNSQVLLVLQAVSIIVTLVTKVKKSNLITYF